MSGSKVVKSSRRTSIDVGGLAASEEPPITLLRDWLDHLQVRGRLAVAKPGCDLRHQIAAIANRLDGAKASFFPSPGGHAIPVISGLTSDRAWMAEAMGVSPDALLARFQDAVERPLDPRERNTGPVQDVVHRDVDLTRQLPVPTHNELDSGPYISAGLLITRDPETGRQNVAIHRLQVNSKNRLGALLLPRHTLAMQGAAERDGRDLAVAIVIGVDPLTLLASQAIVPFGQDELGIAGGLHRAPLDVVKCLTSDIRVPAEAEIVIEGRLLANHREAEGPFGEFPQYYGERADRHVIEVDAITHRHSPIFHTIVGGGLEHLLLGGIPREASMLTHLQRSFSNVLDVHLAKGGVCRYHLYVRMRPRARGEVKNVIMAAFAGHYDVKHVIVVDEDVDIHDAAAVEWAVATRFQADRDLVLVSNAQGSRLDPSSDDGLGAKLGFDATVPIGAPPARYQKISVPGQDRLVLASVLEPTARWRDV